MVKGVAESMQHLSQGILVDVLSLLKVLLGFMVYICQLFVNNSSTR